MKTLKNPTFSLLFWVNKKRIQKNNQLPIYARITVDGRRVELSLQRSIPYELWDQNSQRLKGKGEIQSNINSLIDMTRGKIQSIYNQLLSNGTPITASIIKNTITGIETKPNHKTILDAFDYHNLKMAEIVKVGKVMDKTLERYKFLKTKVETFIKYQYKTNDKALPEIRLAFVTEFEHYLLTIGELKTNTAHKYIKNLKKVMNMAVGLDWIPSNPFNQFKCSYISPEREILNQD